MRRFYLLYPKIQTVSGFLSWSHYVELLKIDDPQDVNIFCKVSTSGKDEETSLFTLVDIHGHSLEYFQRLPEEAGFSNADHLYVIGDVIDRNGDGSVAMQQWMMPK